MLNRKYIFNPGPLSIAMLVYWSVVSVVFWWKFEDLTFPPPPTFRFSFLCSPPPAAASSSPNFHPAWAPERNYGKKIVRLSTTKGACSRLLYMELWGYEWPHINGITAVVAHLVAAGWTPHFHRKNMKTCVKCEHFPKLCFSKTSTNVNATST